MSSDNAWIYLLWEMSSDSGCVQSKKYWAQDWTLRNPVMKLLCEETRPLTLTAWTQWDIYDESHWRALPDIPNVSCSRAKGMLWSNASNAAHKSSKVKMDTWPSSALRRRQFVTPIPSSEKQQPGLNAIFYLFLFSVHVHLLLTCIKFAISIQTARHARAASDSQPIAEQQSVITRSILLTVCITVREQLS